MERNIILLYSLILAMFLTYNVYPQVSNVDVVINESGNFELQRNGIPYYIKGAGAKDHFDLLVQ